MELLRSTANPTFTALLPNTTGISRSMARVQIHGRCMTIAIAVTTMCVSILHARTCSTRRPHWFNHLSAVSPTAFFRNCTWLRRATTAPASVNSLVGMRLAKVVHSARQRSIGLRSKANPRTIFRNISALKCVLGTRARTPSFV
jgi:hypothetical protein